MSGGLGAGQERPRRIVSVVSGGGRGVGTLSSRRRTYTIGRSNRRRHLSLARLSDNTARFLIGVTIPPPSVSAPHPRPPLTHPGPQHPAHPSPAPKNTRNYITSFVSIARSPATGRAAHLLTTYRRFPLPTSGILPLGGSI
ncbi:hypothetical protein J6590_065828 [Homalodisca vitripennis]|nr:hypothetical protein J6590_065828 [Homalodisca vitripennis]